MEDTSESPGTGEYKQKSNMQTSRDMQSDPQDSISSGASGFASGQFKKIIIAGVAIVIILIAVGGIYFIKGQGHGSSSPQPPQNAVKSGSTVQSTTIRAQHQNNIALLEEDLNKSLSFTMNDFEINYIINFSAGSFQTNLNYTEYVLGNKSKTLLTGNILGISGESEDYIENGFNVSCVETSYSPPSCSFSKASGKYTSFGFGKSLVSSIINNTNFTVYSAGTNMVADRQCDNFIINDSGLHTPSIGAAANYTTYSITGNACVDSQYGYLASFNTTETDNAGSTETSQLRTASFSTNDVNQSVFSIPYVYALSSNLTKACTIESNSLSFEFLTLQPLENPSLSIISMNSTYDNATKSFAYTNKTIANITMDGNYLPFTSYNEAVSAENLTSEFSGSICIKGRCTSTICLK